MEEKDAGLPASTPRSSRRWPSYCLGVVLFVPIFALTALLLYVYCQASNPHSHLLADSSSTGVVAPLIATGTRFKVEASVWLKAFDPEWNHMSEPAELGRFSSVEMIWGDEMQAWEEWNVTLPSSAMCVVLC